MRENSSNLLNFPAHSESEILAYLAQKRLEATRMGSQIVVKVCPFCHPVKNKSDQNALKISPETGAYFCHRCNSQGSFFALKRHFGDTPITQGFGLKLNKAPKPAPEVVAAYPENLKLAPTALKALHDRGLSTETINAYAVGTNPHKFFEADIGEWSTQDCWTFPLWRKGSDNKPEAVRIKLRSVTNKRNMRLEPTGGSWGLFGLNLIPEHAETILLTEGELDSMSIYEATKIPACSIPNGANSCPDEVIEILKPFKLIYLWFDNDPAGHEGALRYATRLGIERCRLIAPQVKDANAALTEKLDIKKILAAAKPLPHKNVLHVSELKDAILQEFQNPVEALGVKAPSLPRYSAMIGGLRLGEVTIFSGSTGTGKCLGRDTPVLMFDGTIKKIQDIVAGEKVMGPDSSPRSVLSTTSGVGPLYRINPIKGDSWVCNDVHVLTLRDTRTQKKNQIIDIPLDEYVKKSKSFKHFYKLFRVRVDFKGEKLPLSPYFVGIWLGDGETASTRVHKNEKAIRDECHKIAEMYSLHVNERKDPRSDLISYSVSGNGGVKNPVREILKSCIEPKTLQKRIPFQYLTSGNKQRLELLAGLIDTDGSLSCNGFEITTKWDGLREDILYLSRSLGFAAYSRDKIVNGVIYYRIFISGETSKVPTRVERKQAKKRLQIKNVANTGFSVEAIGEGEYFGFELDGDGRFLLGDFTVTHNTTVLSQMSIDYARQGVGTLWGSFEIKNVKLAKIMLRQYAKKAFNTPAEIANLSLHADDFNQLPIFFTSFFGCTEIDHLAEAIRYAVNCCGVTHVCIDNLQFMTNSANKGNWQDEFKAQGRVLSTIRALATQLNIHITIVIHPRKQAADHMPITSNDIFGPGQAIQEADNIVILQNLADGQTRYIDVRKNREIGKLGKIHYKFDEDTRLISELTNDQIGGNYPCSGGSSQNFRYQGLKK